MWVVAALACLALACAQAVPDAPPNAAPSAQTYPGTLVDPTELGDDFMWRQLVTATFRRPRGELESVSFEAIVQKRGDTLSVLGMTPFGSRGFLIEQRGQDVSLRRFVDGEMPVPARFILIDIHRTFFHGIAADHAGPLDEDGFRTAIVDGEEIRELHRDGRLIERRFRRLDGEPAGIIRIDYGPGAPATGPAELITLDNGWFGYQLVIKTLEQTRL